MNDYARALCNLARDLEYAERFELPTALDVHSRFTRLVNLMLEERGVTNEQKETA